MSKRGRKPKQTRVENVNSMQNTPEMQETMQNSNVNVATTENTSEIKSTPKIEAIKQFKELWQNLPHHNYITDKQAREIHALWQKITGRTDYYSNCSVCTINHIKQIRKIARNEGFEI